MLAPPSSSQRLRELLVGRDLARLAWKSPSLRTLPRGDGDTVVCVTGFGAGDASLAPLRALLRRLGHDARPAGLGRVDDDVEAQTVQLGEQLSELTERGGEPVALVGWSIGGVLSREVARRYPGAVRRVVTFGTPVEGGPSYTALAWRYPEARLAEIRAEIERRRQIPIMAPVTAIWSRNDGIVTPAACIDHDTPHVEHVEVDATHLGMGYHPDVWETVAHRLARPDSIPDHDKSLGARHQSPRP